MATRAPFPKGYRRTTHQWALREIDELIRWEQDSIAGLDQRIATTWAHVLDWTPSPVPASAPAGTRVSGGGRNQDGSKTRTYDHVVSTGTDPMARRMRALIIGIVNIAREIEAITAHLDALASASPDDLTDIMVTRLPAGVGHCANPHCNRWCPGGKDRLRAGRCATCAQYLRRNGVERPHELVATDPEHRTLDCAICLHVDTP